MTTVQEIHASLLNSSVVLNTLEFPKARVRAGVCPAVFLHLLTNQNDKFISRENLERVCKKYDLKLAPSFAFNDTIPYLNQLEIEEFKLHPTLENYTPMQNETPKLSDNTELVRFMMHFWGKRNQTISIGNRGFVGFGNSIRNPYMVNLSTTCTGSLDMLKFLLPLGDKLAIEVSYDWDSYEEDKKQWEYETLSNIVGCCSQFNETDYYRLHLIIEKEVDGMPLFYREEINNGRNDLVDFIQAEMHINDFGSNMLTNITVSINGLTIAETYLNYLKKEKDIKLPEFCTMVVASDQYFAYQQTFVEKDEWELVLPENVDLRSHSGVGFPDPIYLIPVTGGYLIVTMWGDEENIEEVK